MERQARQAERQRQSNTRAAQKAAMLAASANAAAAYEEMVEAMTGAHRVPFARRDWRTDAAASALPAPERRDDAERSAKYDLESYEPKWFERLLRLDGRRRAQLEIAVDAARDTDEADYAAERDRVDARNAEIAHAQRMVALDPATVLDAIQTLTTLGSLPFSIEGASLRYTDTGRIIAVVDGLDLEDMPTQSVSLLQSGKASFKAIAQGRTLEMLRETICSAAIRVAIDILQVVPADAVEIVMLSDLLDRASGHIDASPVLYVRVSAQALEPVNLLRTEASPLVDRLGGHYEWSKRDGFRAINIAAFDIEVDQNEA
jgi:hypothetical protein